VSYNDFDFASGKPQFTPSMGFKQIYRAAVKTLANRDRKSLPSPRQGQQRNTFTGFPYSPIRMVSDNITPVLALPCTLQTAKSDAFLTKNLTTSYIPLVIIRIHGSERILIRRCRNGPDLIARSLVTRTLREKIHWEFDILQQGYWVGWLLALWTGSLTTTKKKGCRSRCLFTLMRRTLRWVCEIYERERKKRSF